MVEDLPLARGTFSSPTFRRTVIYLTSDNQEYQLPYNPATLSGDEGFDTPTYSPQSAETIQDSIYGYNPQQTIAEGSSSSVQQTYRSEWEWSEEHKSWWRLDSNRQYEWHSNASQETSAGEPYASHDAAS